MTPRKLNYYLLVFQDMFPYFLSLFSAIGNEAKEQRDIVWEDVSYAGVTRSALWPCSVIAEEVKQLASRLVSTGAEKSHSKNDFYVSSDSSHDVPYTLWEYNNCV
jgi:hypothetical protein